MKLTLEGIKDKQAWNRAGIGLPSYDLETLAQRTTEAPVWVHFGIGNIFRIFIGSIADRLITDGLMDRGIVCVETFDYETIDRIYKPYDNLCLSVILHNDGSTEKRVFGCFTEALKGLPDETNDRRRLKEIFANPSLQMVSFTITEKGYALRGADGQYYSFIQADIDHGPERAVGAIAVIAAMLLERYQAGAKPLALVSMDNCSQNGDRLRSAVLEIGREWRDRGFVEEEFVNYISDEEKIAFPWTMIDKITPRPGETVKTMLQEAGVEDMDIVVTQKQTYIAPFVNAEEPQYLVVEDHFPGGRPPLEKAGVYMTSRETVNKAERMKVTVCLNPIHTALAPYGCVLGFTLFSDQMRDPEMVKLAKKVGLREGMEFVEDPGIISPKAFIDECINVRFSNPYLGDTPQRIAVDTSQMVGIWFGENIKACVRKYGNAKKLTGIPLAIAGWLRYLLAVDDEGKTFELSPDPMIPELQAQMAGIVFGDPDSLQDQLRPILSNRNIFGIDLYEAGIGETITEMLREEIAGKGAVRAALKKYLA